MKAVRLLEYGGQLVFEDVPTPTIARDEVLVKIESTAVRQLRETGIEVQIAPIRSSAHIPVATLWAHSPEDGSRALRDQMKSVD